MIYLLYDLALASWINGLDIVLQASPIPFRSADHFLYQHAEEGSGELGPRYTGSVQNLDSGLWTGPWTELGTGLWTVLGQLRLRS